MACGRQDCARTPSFMDTRDLKANTVREARDARKGDESLQAVVAVLRRYRYSAVVAHDFEGEYGHAQHKLTADMLAKVVARAADPAYAPDSAEQYGVWQAKKTICPPVSGKQYHHGLDATPLSGQPSYADSAGSVDYSCHFSQQGSFTMESDGVAYDNRKFGLCFSTVGLDVAGNSFTEHIRQ